MNECIKALYGIVLLASCMFLVSGCTGDTLGEVIDQATADELSRLSGYDTVNASTVKDRESLVAFVQKGRTHIEEYGFMFSRFEFKDNREWIEKDIYLYIYRMDGINVFHPIKPELEQQNLTDLTDANGVKIIQELMIVADEGEGFVEYLWDNPDVQGDEVLGSVKVGYAEKFVIGGVPYFIGSGFYP